MCSTSINWSIGTKRVSVHPKEIETIELVVTILVPLLLKLNSKISINLIITTISWKRMGRRAEQSRYSSSNRVREVAHRAASHYLRILIGVTVDQSEWSSSAAATAAVPAPTSTSMNYNKCAHISTPWSDSNNKTGAKVQQKQQQQHQSPVCSVCDS